MKVVTGGVLAVGGGLVELVAGGVLVAGGLIELAAGGILDELVVGGVAAAADVPGLEMHIISDELSVGGLIEVAAGGILDELVVGVSMLEMHIIEPDS